MSYATLDYLLRLTAIWGLLWAYHFVFLRRSAFGWQRAYLLLALVLGPLIPLLPGVGEELPLRIPSLTVYVGDRVTESAVLPGIEAVSKPVWPSVVLAVYGLGVLFIWARSLVQWGRMRSYGLEGQTSSFRSYAVVRHAGVRGPYAAFGRIFLPRSLDDGLLTTALIHEAAHLRARHHYDTLFLTVLAGLCWFHPLFWLLRRALSTVHEFQADAATVREVPLRTYGHQLLKSTLRPGLALGLHASPLKTRIAMLTSPKMRPVRASLLAGTLALFAAVTFSFSDAGKYAEYAAEPTVQTTPDPGWEALLKDVYSTVSYPAAARANGQEITMYVRAEYFNYDGQGGWTIETSQEEQSDYFEHMDYTDIVVIGYKLDNPDGVPVPTEKEWAEELLKAVAPLTEKGPEYYFENVEKMPTKFGFRFKFRLE